MDKIIRYKEENIDSKESISKEKGKGENLEKKKLNWKYIIFPICGFILIGILIVIIYFIKKKSPPPSQPPETEPPSDSSEQIITPNTIITQSPEELGPLEIQTEYQLKTEVDDLTRIYINQIYYEDFKIEGALSKNVVGRKTNYDIYIISETEADEETKKFYNKTYLCSIAISSECVSTNDEYCSPKKLVDLSDQDYSHVKQIRVLEETEDFENFPIPLCFFNLTDNNVITSIACHKNISENRVNSIVLDLYFFRPPGLKRIDKEKANITITSYKEGDKEVIRETNGGICDVENFLGSFCSTDMITKKDSNGNLLTYDEIAFTNITTNEDNFYIKNKTTQLIVDNTEFLNIKDSKRYNETLNILYPNLKNYLKYYVHFSTDDFKELYNITKGIENTNKKNRRRYLLSDENEKPVIIVNEELFNYSHYSGIEISLKLQDM